MNLSNNLKILIKERKITLRDLSKETGVSYGKISELTLGKHTNPGIKSVVSLAEALGVTLDELVLKEL